MPDLKIKKNKIFLHRHLKNGYCKRKLRTRIFTIIMVFRVFKYLVNFFFTFKLFARRILFILSLLGTYQPKSDKLKFVILDISKKKI